MSGSRFSLGRTPSARCGSLRPISPQIPTLYIDYGTTKGLGGNWVAGWLLGLPMMVAAWLGCLPGLRPWVPTALCLILQPLLMLTLIITGVGVLEAPAVGMEVLEEVHFTSGVTNPTLLAFSGTPINSMWVLNLWYGCEVACGNTSCTCYCKIVII